MDADEAAAYEAAIAADYAQYVAVADVPWGNVLAFTAGDPVNADHPALQGWLAAGLVRAV